MVACEDLGSESNERSATKDAYVVDGSSATATRARRNSTSETTSVSGGTLAATLDKNVLDTEMKVQKKTPKASTASWDVDDRQHMTRQKEEYPSSISHQNRLVVQPLTLRTIHVPSGSQLFSDKPPNASGSLCTPNEQPNSWYYPRNSLFQASHVNGMKASKGHQGLPQAQKRHLPSGTFVESGYGVSAAHLGANGLRAAITPTYDNGFARTSNYPEYSYAAARGPVFVKQGQNRAVKPQYHIPSPAPHYGVSRQLAPKHRRESTGVWSQMSNRHHLTTGHQQILSQQHSTQRHHNATSGWRPKPGGHAKPPSALGHWDNFEVDSAQVDSLRRLPPQPFGASSNRRDTVSSHHSVSFDPKCLNNQPRTANQQGCVACPCGFCEAKDRTLYVGPFNQGELSDPKSERKVKDAFSDFGEIEHVSMTKAGSAMFIK